MVGDGPEICHLKKQASELGLKDRIEFVGKVSYEEMQHLYSSSDVFVFPSLRETTGTVLFEAMVNSLPIVTFDQNGAALLVDNNCGIKVNVIDDLSKIKNNFAIALCKVIDDPKLRSSMGHNARLRIIENYTWEQKCKRLYDEYL